MFRNYIKTAIRSLQKNRTYAVVNILGLAVGIAACLLIFMVLQFETSFDNFHAKKNSIYRIVTEFHGGEMGYSSGVALPVSKALQVDFPAIKEVASIFHMGTGQLTSQKPGGGQLKRLTEADICYADPAFFQMFNFKWIAGEPVTALNDPGGVVLTEEAANKYFGSWKDAMGKTLVHDNKYVYKVKGILENPPINTDFPLGVVMSYASLQNTDLRNNMSDWVSTFSDNYCFAVLPPGLSPEQFDKALKPFAKKHKPAEYADDAYTIQPLAEMHYDQRLGNFRGHTFSHSLITALMLIGIFLLLIACVNYINLATAQALIRSREVGVRKVLGSLRAQLVLQFFSETAVIAFISLVAAIVIAQSAMPFLNRLLEAQMPVNLFANLQLLLLVGIIFVVVTILSGLYPSFVLSGFNPVAALKSKMSGQKLGGISLRRGLVIFQFTIAHVLIIGMLIVVGQMEFFRNTAMGFDRAAIVNVPIPGDSISRTKIDYLRNRLLQDPSILSASFSYASPSSNNNWNSDFKFDNSTKNTDFSANLKWADTAYFKLYGLQFVAGRPYFENDSVHEFVVNETLLRKLGITRPENALGMKINFWNGEFVGPIVGVIRDFNSFSLRRPMAPVVLSPWKQGYQVLNVKIQPGTEKPALAYIEKAWTVTYPEYVYEYSFLDETINNFYKQEGQLSQLYKIFGGLAIFISCLGLYGLVSFMAVRRTKEVGIRKVLGASSGDIVFLLSREFTVLVIIAFAVAAPVAGYVMDKWLHNYTYHIPLRASIFLIAIGGSIAIAWITAGYRAIVAAVANPVRSLRTE